MLDTSLRRFVWFYTKSQLKLKYRYTALGFLWNFLEPALYLLVLSLVFSVVNGMNVSDYAVFLFGALMPWRYFEKSVHSCMEAFVGGDWLMKKLYVSPYALPFTRWAIASVEFLFSLGVVFLFFSVWRASFTIHLLALPIAIIPWAAFGLGVGMIAAVLFTFFRDVKTIVQMALMLTFFSSPILFRPDTLAEGSVQARLIALHPITYFAALFQKPIYHAAWPSLTEWAVSVLVAGAALAIGIALVEKYKNQFYFYL